MFLMSTGAGCRPLVSWPHGKGQQSYVRFGSNHQVDRIPVTMMKISQEDHSELFTALWVLTLSDARDEECPQWILPILKMWTFARFQYFIRLLQRLHQYHMNTLHFSGKTIILYFSTVTWSYCLFSFCCTSEETWNNLFCTHARAHTQSTKCLSHTNLILAKK